MPLDPHDAPVLRANRLFIDREVLRERLRELNSSAASRVLVVRGERYSGKSHSRFFFDHLSVNGGGFTSVVVDLVDDEINKPDELASLIIDKIGGDVKQLPSQGFTTAARWGQFIVRAIKEEVQRSGSNFWLIFDGLTKDGLPPETLGIILNLAKRAELEVPQLRVVLLGLLDKLPPEIDGVALREEIGVIDEAKCVTWLQTVLALRRVAPDTAELQAAVARTFQALPQRGDKQRLEHLAREMWRIVSDLTTPAPPAAGLGAGQ